MKTLRSALVLLVLFLTVTGLLYTGAVTALAQALFPREANGSLVVVEGRAVGSDLIGQPFSDARYFWGRPSATQPVPDDARASTGSNLGPLSPALADAVRARVVALRAADSGNAAPVPVDLVTASGSGLDPHLSPAAALYQVGRVARARGLPPEPVRRLVEAHLERPGLGFLGTPRVNVLQLNLALDRLRE
ncbi:MAG TPA: potassium-transporting ATPase subunit KdpC [Anaeromyxobacteraceae bacterium]